MPRGGEAAYWERVDSLRESLRDALPSPKPGGRQRRIKSLGQLQEDADALAVKKFGSRNQYVMHLESVEKARLNKLAVQSEEQKVVQTVGELWYARMAVAQELLGEPKNE